MTKKFNIHNWQAKHLFEQDDFTPDLEDDELKRSKVQQMMAKEKDLANSDYLSDVEPKIEGSQRAALEELANMYSLSEILDTLEDIYAKNDELAAADYAGEFAAKFRKWMDSRDGGEEDEKFMGDWGPHLAEGEEEEIDEASSTGTGTAISTGNSPAYATPKAFSKSEDDWENKDSVYERFLKELEISDEEVPEEEGEEGEGGEGEGGEEEEIEKDIEKIEILPQLDRVNTRDEWLDFMKLVWDMADEITQVNKSHKRQWLQDTLQSLAKER